MAKGSSSLDRLLNTRDLKRIVPQLPPEVLLRVIEHFGLEQCGEFLTLASTAQITSVLDADLWRTRGVASDAVFDVDRFGLWLGVLMQSGVAVAAEKLKRLDVDLVTSGLIGHMTVFDRAAVSAYTTLDGEYVAERASGEGQTAEIGGYRVEMKDSPVADVIGELLLFLEDQHPAYFRRLMRRCVRLSNGDTEVDGFHSLPSDNDQQLSGLVQARDHRRETLGYVAAAEARAFLRSAGNLRLDAPTPPHSPLVTAYYRAIRGDPTIANGPGPVLPLQSSSDAPSEPQAEDAAAAAVIDMLVDEGIVSREPQRLLAAADADATRLQLVRAYIAAHPPAEEELAYLGNVLLAGCRVQGRAFAPAEASAAAASTCNLGLENWPQQWRAVDLVSAFQVGWALLQRDVSLRTAQRLLEVLRSLRVCDRDLEVQLTDVRGKLARAISQCTPWQVRDSLEVLLILDAASWGGLVALLDECPVINTAVRGTGTTHTIDLQQFEFMSTSGDIALAERFLDRLPSMLQS